jgi:hypothetical protein
MDKSGNVRGEYRLKGHTFSDNKKGVPNLGHAFYFSDLFDESELAYFNKVIFLVITEPPALIRYR